VPLAAAGEFPPEPEVVPVPAVAAGLLVAGVVAALAVLVAVVDAPLEPVFELHPATAATARAVIGIMPATYVQRIMFTPLSRETVTPHDAATFATVAGFFAILVPAHILVDAALPALLSG
jgi:hypothetical protein